MYWVAMTAVALMILIGRYPQQDLGRFLYSMTLLPQQGAPAYDVSWTLEREVVFYALAAVTVPIAGIPGLAFVLGALSEPEMDAVIGGLCGTSSRVNIAVPPRPAAAEAAKARAVSATDPAILVSFSIPLRI